MASYSRLATFNSSFTANPSARYRLFRFSLTCALVSCSGQQLSNIELMNSQARTMTSAAFCRNSTRSSTESTLFGISALWSYLQRTGNREWCAPQHKPVQNVRY